MLKLTITALLLGGAFIFTVGFVKVVHTVDGASQKTEEREWEKGSVTLNPKEQTALREYFETRTSPSQGFDSWVKSGACSVCK